MGLFLGGAFCRTVGQFRHVVFCLSLSLAPSFLSFVLISASFPFPLFPPYFCLPSTSTFPPSLFSLLLRADRWPVSIARYPCCHFFFTPSEVSFRKEFPQLFPIFGSTFSYFFLLFAIFERRHFLLMFTSSCATSCYFGSRRGAGRRQQGAR